MNKTNDTDCPNCGHEWRTNGEIYCPLCRWRLDKKVLRQVIKGDKPLNLQYDTPLKK